MKYLNVAEKNAAAKNIAIHFSSEEDVRRSWRDGVVDDDDTPCYNKIYEFEAEVLGQICKMVMTSVSGHLTDLNFPLQYHRWDERTTEQLFGARVTRHCIPGCLNIKATLEREVRDCQGLIIWTDGDREGEHIGFEIIEVCTAVKSDLKIYRARFSEITAVSVRRALSNLEQPNQNISDAVDVRRELDLKIGAAFTRFLTQRLQRRFPRNVNSTVSYGSCQFPTLGFVVERYNAAENFVPERFWKIKVNYEQNNINVDYVWERLRLFDQEACRILYENCLRNPLASVCDVTHTHTSKLRPLPLNTVELEKQVSRILRINAKETMNLAEKLYLKGGISYPRTDTNVFPESLDLRRIVTEQRRDPRWGQFADRILDNGGPTPRQGDKHDEAHPPIYPVVYLPNLEANERLIYEFIVRSFLACCFIDAQGEETVVTVNMAGETFRADGLRIIERNYLDVYNYEDWLPKEIHDYEVGQTFRPSIDFVSGTTSPPDLLTEADLIELMDEHGIGTDATHVGHIEKIKEREYVTLNEDLHFVPSRLGLGLVEGFDEIGLDLLRPDRRAQLEADLKAICEGRRQREGVLGEQIEEYRRLFRRVTAEFYRIEHALARRFLE